jgi:dTMP kinase
MLVEPTPEEDFKFQLQAKDELNTPFGMAPPRTDDSLKLPEGLSFRASDEISRKQWIACMVSNGLGCLYPARYRLDRVMREAARAQEREKEDEEREKRTPEEEERLQREREEAEARKRAEEAAKRAAEEIARKLREEEAAVRIQSVLRGKAARLTVQRLREDKSQRERHQEVAAVYVQSWWKMHAARKRVDAIRREREEAAQRERERVEAERRRKQQEDDDAAARAQEQQRLRAAAAAKAADIRPEFVGDAVPDPERQRRIDEGKKDAPCICC